MMIGSDCFQFQLQLRKEMKLEMLLQILRIHTAKMKENEKMGKDVDLVELSKVTKNFSGAEIEGLVRAAQSCALNRDAT